jgi:hypothetical protein
MLKVIDSFVAIGYSDGSIQLITWDYVDAKIFTFLSPD